MGTLGLTPEEEEYLKELYVNVQKPGSLRGVRGLYDLVKSQNKHSDITLAQIREWLRGVPVYTRWKPARKNFERNKIEAQYPGHLFQFDLMFPDAKEEINGFKYAYVLLGIDVFSRYAFYAALTDRKAKTLVEALKSIFDNNNYNPVSAWADPAGEHKSAVTKNFFKARNIHLYYANSLIHCPHVERFIRTVKTKLRRYSTYYNTNSWVVPVGDIVEAYNNRVTRVHGMTPTQVLRDPISAGVAYARMYRRVGRKARERKKRIIFKVGDYVRISRIRKIFEKESSYLGTFTQAIYRIKKIASYLPHPMYTVEDLMGREVLGKFYERELQKITYQPEKLHVVERILKRRKGRKGEEVKVQWRGYKKSEAKWIPASWLEDVPEGAPVELH